MTAGRYPALGLSEARKLARAAAVMVAEGRDPGAEKIAARAAAGETDDTIGVLLDRFLERHVRRNLKASTSREVVRLIDREIRPRWQSRKVQSVTRRDVVALLDSIADRGTETLANRVLALVRKFFNWLVSRGVIDVSPAAGVKAPATENSRDRVLSDDEIRWLWKATERPDPVNIATRLLLLTGQRRAEVGEMRWGELSQDLTSWTLAAARTKNGQAHSVPLSDLSMSLLQKVRRIDQSQHVFTTNGRTPINGWSKHKSRIDAAMAEMAKREGAAYAEWRLHDLRRTCASGMARLGQPVHVVEKLLNHISGTFAGIVGVYQRHDYADEKRIAAAVWASHIDAITGGAMVGDNA